MDHKLEELAVQYILFNGYYSDNDGGEELLEHVPQTLSLYYEGLNNTYKGDLVDNEDTFNGVCFDIDGTPLAEWWIDGTEEYFPITLTSENT